MKNILIGLLLVLLGVYLGADYFNHGLNIQMTGDNENWQWAADGADSLIAIPVLLLVGAILLFVFAGLAAFLLFIGGVVLLACLLPALLSLLPVLLMAYLVYLLVRKSKQVS
ncbi:hypothetical protein R6242_09920 [Iodobacter sp. CM08]|uniref:hypothetical protein n=1 Tax=Iodobacter sp. CM08 TaxID=3085902 RepID=UPI0029828CEE|nr:hypothetical protein [Iodobacter sp. CM08]MDW5416881.1 hypothetical protein [Iodobacter sp. CM08]